SLKPAVTKLVNNSWRPTAAAASWVIGSSGSDIGAHLLVVPGGGAVARGCREQSGDRVRFGHPVVAQVGGHVGVGGVVGDRASTIPAGAAVEADAAFDNAHQEEGVVEDGVDQLVCGDLHRQPPAQVLGGVQPRVLRASSTSGGSDRTVFVVSLVRSALSTVSARSSISTSARQSRS